MIIMNETITSINELYPTWKDFINANHPSNLVSQYRNITIISESIVKKRLSLGDITVQYRNSQGEETMGVVYLYEWLKFLNIFSNIRPLPDDVMKHLSLMLYVKYWRYFLSDLKLVFERITDGRYGKFYGSVDTQLILYVFREYEEERTHIINKILEEHDRLQKDAEYKASMERWEMNHKNTIYVKH
jgi:hypothetical protein